MEKAKYGEELIKKLSTRLTEEFRKGFSNRNLERMRRFYICFSIATTVSSQLSWSHYLELIKIEEPNKRNFYMNEAINSRRSVRELFYSSYYIIKCVINVAQIKMVKK